MKRIFVIATGGTIAGVGEAGGRRYRSGELSVAALLESVPELAGFAQIEAHQLANIGSQDMSEALWFELATLIADKCGSADGKAAGCDGVVVIHGTDTLEETAFFLHCVLPPTAIPVVLTGAMRPATAPEPDGPANLMTAVAVAASDTSAGRGVLVTFAGRIFAAASVAKCHTQGLHAFSGGASGACGTLGRIEQGVVVYDLPAKAGAASPQHGAACQPPLGASPDTVVSSGATSPSGTSAHSCTTDSSGVTIPFDAAAASGVDLAILAAAGSLPPVAIVTAHVGQRADVVEALVQLGYRGIVYAGLGNGNCPSGLLAALEAARAQGVVIVRASRVPFGGVSTCGEVDDAALGFVCAGSHTPQQARILLALALVYSSEVEQIRKWFLPQA